eukprot:COSAG01_NODE_10192_length_2225_cov_5.393227_2_plen_88_part_00
MAPIWVQEDAQVTLHYVFFTDVVTVNAGGAMTATSVIDPIRGVLGSPRNPPISNNIFKISHGGGVPGDPYTPLGFPTLACASGRPEC